MPSTSKLLWVLSIAVPLAFSFSGRIAIARQSAPVHKAKATEAASSFSFEPLDTWKAAVLAGDRNTLDALYSTNPPVQVKTPQGDVLDPTEEPMFWASLRAAGLDHLTVKVLQVQNPQPGIMALVLRVEAQLKTAEGEKAALVSTSQVWMQKIGEWRIVQTRRSALVAKPTMRLPEPAKPNIDLYPPPGDAPGAISTALAAASKDHKRVLLVFGGNWCYDCHVLDTTFRSRAIAPLVNANYHVVHVNIGNYDVNLDIAQKYGVPLNKGVPCLAVLDPDGTVVYSQKEGQFESTVKLAPEDVTEFLKKWKPQHGG
jgi:thioredoxin 1